MNDALFEQRVIQNPGLAAEALWYAVYEAYESSNRVSGIPLPLIFVVLPLVFHKRTATSLCKKTQPGALYKALAEDREIPIGLQVRLESMADKTFESLSIAFDSNLIDIDSNNEMHLIPNRKTMPIVHASDELKVIFNAAKRVGQAMSEMSLIQLVTHLRINF